VTTLDIITMAMLEIGALGKGEVPDGDESSDAFARANNMLDSWNAERLMIYSVVPTRYHLTAGQQTYYMGPTAVPGAVQLSAANPRTITRLGILSLNNAAQPLELPMDYLTEQQWALIPVKNVLSALPLKVWDDQGYPSRTLWFWTIPSVAIDVMIYAWVPLNAFPDLSATQINLPPGYLECVIYNLALRLAPSYMPPNVPVNPLTAAQAQMALGRVRTGNSRDSRLYCDPALVRAPAHYNWLSDQPV